MSIGENLLDCVVRFVGGTGKMNLILSFSVLLTVPHRVGTART